MIKLQFMKVLPTNLLHERELFSKQLNIHIHLLIYYIIYNLPYKYIINTTILHNNIHIRINNPSNAMS